MLVWLLDDADWVFNAIEAKIKLFHREEPVQVTTTLYLLHNHLYLASPLGRPRNLTFSVTEEEWYRVRGTGGSSAPSLMSFGRFSAGGGINVIIFSFPTFLDLEHKGRERLGCIPFRDSSKKLVPSFHLVGWMVPLTSSFSLQPPNNLPCFLLPVR